MPVATVAPGYQDATQFGLPELAGRLGLGDLESRLYALALSQGITTVLGWYEKASIVLATRYQVEDRRWCEAMDVRLFVRCTGAQTAPFKYPQPWGKNSVQLPVQWAGGRDKLLDEILFDILLALSQGGTVVLHCNESFHRGPIGFMAVCATLFGANVSEARTLLLERRIIYEAFASEEVMAQSLTILRPYNWAKSLVLWRPAPMKDVDPDWGPASSQGRGGKGGKRKNEASASSQGPASASSQGPAPSSTPASSAAAASTSGAPAPASSQGGSASWKVKSGVSEQAARKEARKEQAPLWRGEYLYRAMTVGLKELEPARAPWMRRERLAEEILRSVQEGSDPKKPSPFLHFTWSHTQARHWKMRGIQNRGESDTIMCRVPVAALSQVTTLDEPLQAGAFIDLSTSASSQELLAQYSSYSAVQDRLSCITHAHHVKEALVTWRGDFPRHLLEVVHPDSEEFLRMLDPKVPISSTFP